ncbi:FAD-binding and (Fe-S)-binding domain-containing protein [Polynucleobacter sp. AP-Latsch-80-C2]|jgi:FAD/FMN-containing dehydrogenase/Fe-S oxidoreductase|uniref:FAD-binding and (Fe-S)-binding domain-containing protein n=1 Tax=Polynucleobacter sp. AP-Latsch-80-C2 TaxID=2576931 RepID=UPI001C0C25CA|nr:FAD-binding and (Fe-S)-binding domain-containing protein [Polynucleobacter sp. AP-Latsch-80-C2]MBU3622124.1 FAD-binding protein [Polynucleobacter sp. AP-Latsch-80-C2]
MNKPMDIKEVMVDQALLAKRLQQETSGEVMTDIASRGRYATDASIYQAMPVAVLVPKTAEDIAAAIQIAAELNVPVLPRGGGTSQCGQTTGTALVIDNSKYFRNVLDLNIDKGYVEVQPGIVLDHLNAQLKQHGLWYPVDVSTGGQATIGGMAGNNSCGSRSIAYGNMVHNVLGIDAWLANGQIGQFADYANSSGVAKQLGDFVKDLANTLQPEIETRFPKVLRRVAGYNLDIFHPQSELPYTQDGSVNLSHLLVGSEGTLAYFKSLKLKLSPLAGHKVLGIVNFASFYKAMDSAQHIVKLGPTAVELVDRTMIDLARSNPSFQKTIETSLINPQAQTPEAILLVEFSGESQAPLLDKLKALEELMGDLGLPGTVVKMPDANLQKNLWEVRKAGLNIMMSLKGDGKPVSFIEDCAVPLESLAEYTQALTDVFSKYGSRGTWYAHASVGTLHVRPILDMRRDGAQKMRAVAEEASELVRKYKGAYSGEHGDGLCRGEWISWQFGPKITEALSEIKYAFDPKGLFNPGKIINPPKMDDVSNFRFPPSYKVIPLQPALDWSAWNVQNDPVTEQTTAPGTGGDPAMGLAKAVEMCNNNGHCRKFDAEVMCPSYRVTRDEKHLTRGRANTLRLALSNQLDVKEGTSPLASDAIKEVMELCVSCKACRRECPTGVDMAKMKIEFLSAYKKRTGHSLRDLAVAYLPKYAATISNVPFLPAILNLRNHIAPIAKLQEWIMGISAQRSLPVWKSKTFWSEKKSINAHQFTPEQLSTDSKKGVVLLADTFNAYFEDENLKAALQVLKAAGYRVHIPHKSKDQNQSNKNTCSKEFCCGRTYLAAGMVDKAKETLGELVDHLAPYADKNIPIIGLEPSCLFTLKDEALVMGFGERAISVSKQAQLLEEFLAKEAKDGKLQLKLKAASKPVLFHGHCHQKSFAAVTPAMELLKLIPNAEPKLIESSCCGMAGSFGYEAEHIEVSKKMAEANLLPAIRKAPDAWVVADGTSCRHQIADGTQREAVHIAKILAAHL